MDVGDRGAVRVAVATVAWAAVHSALASGPAKAAAERALGTRARNGLYRAGYNGVAVITFALLVGYVRRQPCSVLYRVRGPAAVLMRACQGASLLYAAWGVLQVGVGGLSGVANLTAWLTGAREIPREPEGQTPAPQTNSSAARVSPFGLTRQALNFFLLPLLWLNPRMTTRLTAFNLVATAYLYLGSVHSERRLRRFYGPAYEQAYARRGVPFFLPRIARGAREAAGPLGPAQLRR